MTRAFNTRFAWMVFAINSIVVASAQPTGVLRIDSDKQFLIDELFFEQRHNVRLSIESPKKTGEIVLQREHPWESATLNFFSVIEDQGVIDTMARYRMWYEAYDIEGWPTTDDTSFCYAESRDGIHWVKPVMNLVAYHGNKQNNILFRQIGADGSHSRVHGHQVFKDEHAPTEQRYKAVSQGMFSKLGSPPHRIAGMFSANGIHWTRYSDPIVNVFADSQYSGFWDPDLGRYVLFGRASGGRGRSVGRSESERFDQFPPLELVMQRDDREADDIQIYNPAVIRYQKGVYLAFPSLFHVKTDTLDIALAVSRDSKKWTRPAPLSPYIPLGSPSDWDNASHYMGQGLLRTGDELWLYYSGSPIKHAENELPLLTRPGQFTRAFTRVVTRADRFVAAFSDKPDGRFVTPQLVFSGDHLKINFETMDGGAIRVGLIDARGISIKDRGLDDCIPLVGDALNRVVRWQTGSHVEQYSGTPVRVEFELNQAKLFTFQFASDDAARSRRE